MFSRDEQEKAFQLAIDSNIEESLNRLVFADWLEEIGDPRAEGYRTLGLLRKYPIYRPSARDWKWGYWCHYSNEWTENSILRSIWWGKYYIVLRRKLETPGAILRVEADDIASLAWLELRDEEKSDILNSNKRIYA